MASFTEKIRVLLELDGDGAESGFKRFRTSVSEADGVTGKFKAGASSAFQSIKDNAGAMALGAGTAIAAFAVKAVHEFEQTAKAAIDLGSATGLSTEAASRWIAVGDDFGVTAEGLQGGIGKIAKSLDDAKWDKYGIETRDAAGKARDANAILIDSLATLSNISNATERARVGNELFGKGYSNLAPLIGHTREEYEDMLGAVEDGQVITDKEAKKAEDMRKAEDALADALKEVTLQVGQAVAGFAPFIQKLAETVAYLEKIPALKDLAFAGFSADAGDVTFNLMELGKAGEDSGDASQDLVDHNFTVKGATKIMEDYAKAQAEAKDATEETSTAVEEHSGLTDEQRMKMQAVTSMIAQHEKALKDDTQAQKDAIEAAKDRLEAEEDLRDFLLSQIDAGYAYMQSVRDTTADVKAYNDEIATGKLTQDELATATEQARQSVVKTAEAYANTTGAAQGSNEWINKVIESLYNQAVALDPNSPLRQVLVGYISQLQSVPKTVSTTFEIKGPGRIRIDGGTGGGGTPTNPGSHGNELFTFGDAGIGGVAASPGSGNMYVNINTSADPNAVVTSIKQFQRTNGT